MIPLAIDDSWNRLVWSLSCILPLSLCLTFPYGRISLFLRDPYNLPDVRLQNSCSTETNLSTFALVQNSELKLIPFQLNCFSCFMPVINGIEPKSIPLNLKHSPKEKHCTRAEKNVGSEASLLWFQVLLRHQLPVWY